MGRTGPFFSDSAGQQLAPVLAPVLARRARPGQPNSLFVAGRGRAWPCPAALRSPAATTRITPRQRRHATATPRRSETFRVNDAGGRRAGVRAGEGRGGEHDGLDGLTATSLMNANGGHALCAVCRSSGGGHGEHGGHRGHAARPPRLPGQPSRRSRSRNWRLGDFGGGRGRRTRE